MDRTIALSFVVPTLFLIPLVVFADQHFTDTSIDVIEEQTFDSPDELAEFLGEDSFDDIEFHNGGVFSEFAESPLTVPGTVSCFDYYTFGSVQVDLTSSVETVAPGVPVEFSAVITNGNPYPVVNGSLVVKIFRENENFEERVAQGNHTVDQFNALPEVNLRAGERASYMFSWLPPERLPAGRYYVATHFVTEDRFNLLGLTFTDDIAGNLYPVDVVSDHEPIYFDKSSVRVNGEPYRFIGQPLGLPDGPVGITADVINDSDEDVQLTLVWFLFRWDALRTENLIERKTSNILVPAGGKTQVQYTAVDEDFSVYLAVPVLYQESGSISGSFLNIRFLRNNVDVPRINFPSIFQYPLVAGEEASVFSCVHNAGLANIVENTRMELTLRDARGNIIHEYTYQGAISGAMMGLVDTFTPRRTYTNFSLTASLFANDRLVEEVEIFYDCSVLNPGEECEDERGLGVSTEFLAGGALAIVLVLLIAFFMFRKKKPQTV